MIRFLILAGYFEITMYLQLSGKLNQYINMHFSYLAYISMILSFVLAIVQLIVWMKKMRAAAKKYLKKDVISVTTENYMEIMEVLYDYPDEFAGKRLEFTGFVYNDPSNKNSQFLFRFGIIHCIADSGVYGLLTTGNTEYFENNTWIRASGKITIRYHKQLGQSLPTLEVDSFKKVEKPSNPYVYRVF